MCKYQYQTYWAAKMAMVALWTTDRKHHYVRCAVCGRETKWPEAHHLYLSQRYKQAKCDLRNVVPVCNPRDSPKCHALRVHGQGKEVAANRHYRILGKGDPHVGRQIVVNAATKWGMTKTYIPEVKED